MYVRLIPVAPKVKNMYIKNSSQLNRFKRQVGQSNHMLITILVGLDAIDTYDVVKKSEFSTSWNPQNKQASVDRAKVYSKKATLVWIVDNIDMYLRLINRVPSLIDNDIKKAYDDEINSKSVLKRLSLLCDHLGINSIDYALVELLITWRNLLTHFDSNNSISSKCQKILHDNNNEIKSNYCNLDIDETLERFFKKDVPTFKETTSFVRATINLVYEIDGKLLSNINLSSYAQSIIIGHIKQNKNKRLNDIFSKGSETAYKKLLQILVQNGFKYDEDDSIECLCKKISELKYEYVAECVDKGTFTI